MVSGYGYLFNIPGFGPLIMTTDADIFKDNINKLSANGGGDIPELCLSGLQVLTKVFPHVVNLDKKVLYKSLVFFFPLRSTLDLKKWIDKLKKLN